MTLPHIKRRETPEAVKRAAHVVVWEALAECELMRPGRCESCRRVCKPDAAHKDYDEPLDVWWLCASCHAAYDIYGIDPRIPKF